jgi:CRISPR-associated protein Csx17
MNKILLKGCQTRPLAGYLKALGVLRIVAEQADAKVLCRWTEQGFELHSSLTLQQIFSFFLDDYCPTPVIAPWNGGSGYYPKDNAKAIDAIISSRSRRLNSYKNAIETAREQVKAESLTESPKDPQVKNRLLNQLRSELDEPALNWLDAALTLNGASQKFPPLLGTGGNDGRLDFSNNFMQRLVALIDTSGQPTSDSKQSLEQALLDTPAYFAQRAAIGQFAPDAAGSYNGSTGFSSNATASSWDYVLMIEGTMLFASAAGRRLDTHVNGAPSFPFTTRSVGTGSGATHASDEADARAEIWLPLWRRPSGVVELRQLFREGRVTLERRTPRDGLEFARAVSLLGTTRGISAFERYAFLMRSGKAYVATPIGRFFVPASRQKNLLAQLEENQWLGKFNAACRDKNAPARMRSLQAPLREQMFALTQANTTERAQRCQAILKQLGTIERYAARSQTFRDNVPPLLALDTDWAISSDSDTPEYRIAAAIASIRTKDNKLSTRQLISPASGRVWNTGSSRDVVWQHPDISQCLSRALDRLSLRALQANDPDHGLTSQRGCGLNDIAVWLDQATCNDSEIYALIPGLALLAEAYQPKHFSEDENSHLPTAYRVLKLLFCGNTQLHRVGLIADSISLHSPRPILRHLQAGDVARALKLAVRKLRIAGISVPNVFHCDIDSVRLTASLLIPLNDRALKSLAHSLKLATSRNTINSGVPA